MKCKLLVVMAVLLSGKAFSQDKIIYLDSLRQPTSKENHVYYRIVKDYNAVKDLYPVSDYYKSGVMQMQGFSSSKDNMVEQGEFLYYYEDGSTQIVENYTKGKLTGNYAKWRKNGNKEIEGEYIPREKNEPSELRIFQFWDAANNHTVIDGNGDYDNDTETESSKGKIKDGFKDGVWTGSDKRFKFTYTEEYSNARLVSGSSIDKNNITHQYNAVELKPSPKRGIDDFYKYIGKKYKIPSDAGEGGKIVLGFVIDKEGKITDSRVTKSVSDSMDKEALRVLNSYRDWIPGELRGIKVKVAYTIPINIVVSN